MACDAAKEVGADVVKFQTWKTEKIITQNVSQAEYQVTNTGIEETQYEMLKKLELSYDDFRKIKNIVMKLVFCFHLQLTRKKVFCQFFQLSQEGIDIKWDWLADVD